ncbi:MAG: hypothetical protein K2O18_10250 [Oscillospiraceae bacterium]|nr:hypothetical protein [Oscillospiraceae bacterium]
MELDSVSFLFEKSELILLLRLLGCESITIPSEGDDVDTEGTLERLQEDQLISGSREALAVDQVIAFLLLAMDGAPFRLEVSGGRYLAVFKAASVSIVLQERGVRWLIAPFPVFSEARMFLLRALEKVQPPCSLTVHSKSGIEQLRFQTKKALAEAAGKLLPVEEDEVKEKWKP